MNETRIAEVKRLLTSIGAHADAIDRLTDAVNADRAAIEKLLDHEAADCQREADALIPQQTHGRQTNARTLPREGLAHG